MSHSCAAQRIFHRLRHNNESCNAVKRRYVITSRVESSRVERHGVNYYYLSKSGYEHISL